MGISVQSLDGTREIAGRVLRVLRGVGWVGARAVVLGLSGDLGVGKTAFVQCIAKVLGVSETVTSPTFVLRCDYETSDAVFKYLTHIDVYRLECVDEIDTIGWDAVLAMPHTLVIVEWAEKFSDRLPDDVFSLAITTDGENRIFSADFLAD